MLIIDCQDDVRHSVCDLIICGKVEWSHTDRSDHILDFWVVSNHPKVFYVVLTFCCRGAFAGTLREEVVQLIQNSLGP